MLHSRQRQVVAEAAGTHSQREVQRSLAAAEAGLAAASAATTTL